MRGRFTGRRRCSSLSLTALSPLLLPVALVVLHLPSTVLGEGVKSSSELASVYGLTLSEYDSIISSEAPYDFGADDDEEAEDEESDELFLAATARQWDFNQRSILAESLGPANAYYPYIACYSDPELSGYRRILHLIGLFESAVTNENSIFIGDTIVNVRKARTCVWTSSSPADPFRNIADTQPEETTKHLEYQPHMFSMKIVDGTTELIAERMANPEPDKNRLGVVVRTCPVYSEYVRLGLATRQDLTEALVRFLTDRDLVRNSSFYVEASQDESIASTPRMDWWAEIITNVTDRVDPTTGASVCFDVVIARQLKFAEGYKDTIEVYVESYGDSSALTEAEFQECLWYVVAGLALHPFSCQIEPEIYKVPLPPVPSPTAIVPSGEVDHDLASDNGHSSSSGASGIRAFPEIMVCGTVLLPVIVSLALVAQ